MINNISLQRILKTFEQNTAVKKASATAEVPATADKLDLSSQGVNFQRLSDGNIPAVPQEKLDAIKDAVMRGEYKVDYDKLADALISQNIVESE